MISKKVKLYDGKFIENWKSFNLDWSCANPGLFIVCPKLKWLLLTYGFLDTKKIPFFL